MLVGRRRATSGLGHRRRRQAGPGDELTHPAEVSDPGEPRRHPHREQEPERDQEQRARGAQECGAPTTHEGHASNVPSCMVHRSSIARSVQASLLGLTIVLTAIAAIGIAGLYASRQHYEDRLGDALSLQASAGKLLAAGVVEEATLRLAPGAMNVGTRARAERAFEIALREARTLAANDELSAWLVDRAARAQEALREAPRSSERAAGRPRRARPARRPPALRIADARADARRDSRLALVAIVAGGLLALVSTLALVAGLVNRMRKPLDDLVEASQRLAGGEEGVRVPTDGGPRRAAGAGSVVQRDGGGPRAGVGPGGGRAPPSRGDRPEPRRRARDPGRGRRDHVGQPARGLARARAHARDAPRDRRRRGSAAGAAGRGARRRGHGSPRRPDARGHRGAHGGRRRRRVDGARRVRARPARAAQDRVRRHRLARAAQPADVDQGVRRASRRQQGPRRAPARVPGHRARVDQPPRRPGQRPARRRAHRGRPRRDPPPAVRSGRDRLRGPTLMRPRIEARHQTLRVDVPDELPKAMADPGPRAPDPDEPADQRPPVHGRGRDHRRLAARRGQRPRPGGLGHRGSG